MTLFRELRQNDPDDLKNYLRMDGEDFDFLLKMVGPAIQSKTLSCVLVLIQKST